MDFQANRTERESWLFGLHNAKEKFPPCPLRFPDPSLTLLLCIYSTPLLFSLPVVRAGQTHPRACLPSPCLPQCSWMLQEVWGRISQLCLQFMNVNPPWALGSAWQSHPISPASSLCCLQRDNSLLNPLQATFLLTQLVMTLLLISLRTQRKNIVLPFLYRICHLTIISTKDSALRLLSMDELCDPTQRQILSPCPGPHLLFLLDHLGQHTNMQQHHPVLKVPPIISHLF